jgi:ATP-dependent DNA helicase DinG
LNITLDTFISLDLETTGLDVSADRIIEIGAVKYEKGVQVGTYSQLVNPGIAIPPDIVELTGITEAMVAGAPKIEEVMPEFEAFLGDFPLLVGQNVRFDIGFIKNHLSLKYLSEIDQFFLDTAALARMVWPGLKSYGLSSLTEFLRVDLDEAHRAFADADATARVYLYQLAAMKRYPQKIKNFVAGILFGAPYRGQVLQSLDEVSPELPSPVAYDYDFGDNIIGESELEPRDDFREIDIDKINELFDTNLRQHLRDYEDRPQQLQMAAKVATAFNNAEILLAEAPTGIGKSLAYLVPSILWSKINGDSVMISTQTRNLQDQLFNNDIPLVAEATKIDFKAVLLKGRGNYLCLFKYYEVLNEAINTFGIDDRLALMPAIVWAETTKTGDIAECSGFYPGRFKYMWSRMSCEGNFCLRRAFSV